MGSWEKEEQEGLTTAFVEIECRLLGAQPFFSLSWGPRAYPLPLL